MFREVEDAETIEQLEREPKVKVYRAMQLIDGELYPPMSAKVDGEMRKPTRLYGAKLLSKAAKHGYDISPIRNLPKALATPIAVFSGSTNGSYAILTEFQIDGKKVLAALSLGKGGHDGDFNIISSVYGKRDDSIVRWINDRKLLYADKEKALGYISVSAPIAEAQYRQELNYAAKIANDSETASIEGRNFCRERNLFREVEDAETIEQKLKVKV